MKKWLALVYLLGSLSAFGQLMHVEVGQTISSFGYRNSMGGTLENLQATNATYLGAAYLFQLPGEKLYVILGAMLNNYGAVASDALRDNFFEWDVTYAGLQTGLHYTFARSKDFQFFVRPTATLEYLVRGTQTLNNQVFDLSGEDEFDNFLVVPRLGVGVQYPISNKAALYLQYSYGRSFSLVNSNPNDNEKLNINMHNIGIGMVIQLPGCNCAFNQF
jgi:opacity protein-like surface antigen